MVLDKARQQYLGNELFWAADLIAVLEAREPGRALAWASACATALTEESADPNKDQLLHWLSELASTSARQDPAELFERSRHTWFHHRDELHTAVAHLFTARGYLARGDHAHYRRALVDATDVMGRHRYYRSTGAELPLDLFRAFEESIG